MVAILLVLLCVASTRWFRLADSPPAPAVSRINSLDGLRGFLALAVFFHHAAIYHTYTVDHVWSPPPDRLYALLGPLGVSTFFMITGFLFWGQVIGKKGRPDWLRLYVGRVFRIGPLYLTAAALMMVVVFAMTGPYLRVRFFTLAAEIGRWAALGFWTSASLNGFRHPGDFLANVTWSLHWEWLFYGSLILTAQFARVRWGAWLAPGLGFLGSCAVLIAGDRVFGEAASSAAFIALFSIGMLTAASKTLVSSVRFGSYWFSLAALAPVLVVLSTCGTTYALGPICLLGLSFFFIANGATLFGLLATRPARRLGDISYGIYLLQGLTLAAAFDAPGARAAALASPWIHWLLTAVAALALVALATLAHAFVEVPGVAVGRRLSRAIEARLPMRGSAGGSLTQSPARARIRG